MTSADVKATNAWENHFLKIMYYDDATYLLMGIHFGWNNLILKTKSKLQFVIHFALCAAPITSKGWSACRTSEFRKRVIGPWSVGLRVQFSKRNKKIKTHIFGRSYPQIMALNNTFSIQNHFHELVIRGSVLKNLVCNKIIEIHW